MSVEFVFDTEGQRYRVFRSFARSATGKTNKSLLELQLLAAEGEEDSIPLTGASMRETQEKLNECLGLDYDAFVNSSMLLQGRSDEFTKKRPAERKNILGRILNLSRYDRLADKARVRLSGLNTEAEKIGREIELLSQTLEDEPRWKESLATIVQDLEREQAVLATLRTEEAALSEKVGTLQSLTREYNSISDSIKKTANQSDEREHELQLIVSKIEVSTLLINSREEIQTEYDSYISYLKERDELDLQRDVYRGLEKQLEATRASLAVERTELEGAIKRSELEIRHKEQAFSDVCAEIEKKEGLEKELEAAIKAEMNLEKILKEVKKRDELEEEVKKIEKKILGEQKHLKGTLEVIQEQLRARENKESVIASLRKELDDIGEQAKMLKNTQAQLEQITAQGQAVGDEIQQIEVKVAGCRSEKEKIELRVDQLLTQEGGRCPTCGSSLGKDQLDNLVASLNEELIMLKNNEASAVKLLEEKESQRNELRKAFKSSSSKANEYIEQVNKELQLKERLLKYTDDQAQYLSLVEKEKELSYQLKAGNFAVQDSALLTSIKNEIAELQIDERVLANHRFKAAQIDRYKEKLRAISFAEGKKEHLGNQVKQQKEKVVELRNKLDSGDAFSKLKADVKEIEEKLIRSSFEPKRYEFVRDWLKKGRAIPDKMKDLSNAEKNQNEWLEEKKRLSDIISEMKENLAGLEKKRKEIEALLADGSTFKAQLSKKSKEREESEQRLTGLQQRKGEVQARMQHITEAKASRKKARATLKDVRDELNVYKKLRTAFGKNGIQSLIIEQALPEIEERASEILFRLTEGKMQVHLETMKDKKSGGTKETLEIIITDDQGVPRSYETYSGGEAFRINFALRIALSQILAERSGVRIRTLGIDEGFGTQDEEGIQYLIEAIQEVQDDFEKILVITHLDRLKEAFPVRIEVVKDPLLGSQLSLIEQ